ncbi:MAG: hypothetical protein AB8B64_17755 [Granulosicoccus sp.]
MAISYSAQGDKTSGQAHPAMNLRANAALGLTIADDRFLDLDSSSGFSLYAAQAHLFLHETISDNTH